MRIKRKTYITTPLFLVFGMLYSFLWVGCKATQSANENFKCISENHYFFIGTSASEMGKQLYKNFSWSNVAVSDREFEGKVYVRFFVNSKNEFSSIEILTKTNSPSIDKELIRCVKLIQIPHHPRMNKKALVEVIAFVSF